MTFDDVFPKENELIKNEDLKAFDKFLYSILVKKISENIDVRQGRMELTDTTDSIVKKSIKELYRSKKYQGALEKYLTNIKDLSSNKIKLYGDKGFSVAASEINPFQKIAIEEHLSYLNENGLNSKFNQPLRKIIYSSVYAGKSQSELFNELKSYVSENNNLGRYIKNVAIQGADAYTSIIDQKITDKYVDRVKGYMMVGTLIETSSPQCKFCVKELKRKITKENFDQVYRIAAQNGLIEGTEFKDLPTNKLHWGCRHQFTPIIE